METKTKLKVGDFVTYTNGATGIIVKVDVHKVDGELCVWFGQFDNETYTPIILSLPEKDLAARQKKLCVWSFWT